MDFFMGYQESKIKPYLKMAVQRIKMLNNKKTTGVKLQKKEIAKMIAEGKTEMAAIKVEHIIREDFTIEGYSVLELLCELVHERIKQVTNEKSCPAEMQQAINSLIWAASCVDISELKEIRNQLVKKYGKGYAKIVMENQENMVNQRLYEKLSYKPPTSDLVMAYLDEIAKVYQIDWNSTDSGMCAKYEKMKPLGTPSGASIVMAPGSGLRSAYTVAEPTAPQVELDEFEIAEREQFIRNQAQNRVGNATSQPSTTPIPALPRRNGGYQTDYDTEPVYEAATRFIPPPVVQAEFITDNAVNDSSFKISPAYPNYSDYGDHGTTPASTGAETKNNSLPLSPATPEVKQETKETTKAEAPEDPVTALQARLAALQKRDV